MLKLMHLAAGCTRRICKLPHMPSHFTYRCPCWEPRSKKRKAKP